MNNTTNDEPAFDVECYVISCVRIYRYGGDYEPDREWVVDNPGSTFSVESRVRRQVKTYADKKEPVAFLFVPLSLFPEKDERDRQVVNYPSDFSLKIAACLGINGIVPDKVKHVIVLDASMLGKLDVKRKCLAFNPKNIVIADLCSMEDGICKVSDFSFDDDGNMSYSGEAANKNTRAYIAGRAIAFMAQQCELADKLSSVHWNFQSSMKDWGCNKENVDNQTKSYFPHLEHARFTCEVIGFGHDFFPDSALDKKAVRQMIARNLIDDPKSHLRTDSWDYRSDKRDWVRPRNIDAIKPSAFGIEFTEDEKSILNDMEQALIILEDLKKIWKHYLSTYDSILSLPSGIPMSSDTKKRSLAVESFHALGHVYGIDAAIESYFSGVPIEDILA